ncbi:MAG: MnhB domain-containing protein [Verrucomicrobiota bacterium]
MQSTLLNISSKYLSVLLFLLSLVTLYRGHNLPGGGFIGGLIAACALLTIALATGWEKIQQTLPIRADQLMIVGLCLAIASGAFGLVVTGEFMQGMWLPKLELPIIGKVMLGTPLLFDIGVYLTVCGFTIQCAEALATSGDSEWTH